MMQTEIALAVGDLPQCPYFAEKETQYQSGVTRYGGTSSLAQFPEKLA